MGSKDKPSYYERNRERVLNRLNNKYASDKEFREKAKNRSRERYHNDPEYRKKTIERAKKAYREKKSGTEQNQ